MLHFVLLVCPCCSPQQETDLIDAADAVVLPAPRPKAPKLTRNPRVACCSVSILGQWPSPCRDYVPVSIFIHVYNINIYI